MPRRPASDYEVCVNLRPRRDLPDGRSCYQPLCLLLGLLTLSLSTFAQSRDTKAEPKGGKAALQIIYYKIDFTPEELEYLRTHAAELIFSVDIYGRATLQKINDIEMRSIVDKMKYVNDPLPEFIPETVNGRTQNGIYFLQLAWPNYQGFQTTQGGFNNPYQNLQFANVYSHKLSDFSEINYRGPRYDMVIGFLGASVAGNISKSLNNGWGTKFDFMFYGRRGWGGGFVTTLIFAQPAAPDKRQPGFQTRAHMLALFTGAFGKISGNTRAGQFGVQIEPGFGISDIVRSNSSTVSPFATMGFTPGIVGVYLLPLGKGRMGRQYFLPVAYRNYLNFHLAARQLRFNTTEGSGMVYEFGLSYRLSTRSVANYKLKESNH